MMQPQSIEYLDNNIIIGRYDSTTYLSTYLPTLATEPRFSQKLLQDI